MQPIRMPRRDARRKLLMVRVTDQLHASHAQVRASSLRDARLRQLYSLRATMSHCCYATGMARIPPARAETRAAISPWQNGRVACDAEGEGPPHEAQLFVRPDPKRLRERRPAPKGVGSVARSPCAWCRETVPK